jgi:hypothetical protein
MVTCGQRPPSQPCTRWPEREARAASKPEAGHHPSRPCISTTWSQATAASEVAISENGRAGVVKHGHLRRNRLHCQTLRSMGSSRCVRRQGL